ncbi:hypothetical protein VN12_06335 [Pirellula sp. SH-Sr6A]|uniref:hypothetical protein n=1 Tax=Pirellula sp. SH-Sr6A TaxID=1632865 RepID=UPI00078D6F74|nr:hypothetical protein [Pirellula sp. SH-Sr6A]AMV31720.1 hypothetical protein VN12_06335 [Pirellula sp. SH-Sr6A]
MSSFKFAVQSTPTYNAVVVRGPKGDKGDEGASGTSEIGAQTATDLTGLLYGNGSTVSSLSAASGRDFLEVLSQSETQSAITAALAAYTPTANLAPIATSGSASDLITGTLANARLSPQVVRSDFSYSDPAWISAIAASKLTGFVDDARLSGNVALKNGSNVFSAGNTFQASQVFDASIVVGGVTGPRIRAVSGVFRLNNNADSARAGLEISDLTATGNASITGTLQIGGAGAHLLRWNSGASSLEVRDSSNSFYRKMRFGELQAIADLGGSFATPANARIGLLTQIGGYIAGAISGRTYSSNAIHGDVIISASVNMTTGQNDYSGLTDDLAIRGNTGNVEINRGLLGIGMAGQSARSVSILPVNTGDRTGVRVYDYGAFASAVSQTGFDVAYLGGTLSAPATPVSGHYRNILSFKTGGTNGLVSGSPSFAIRSTIGSVIGSSLCEVNTSFMVTPTITGVTTAVQTIFGQSGLVDFPIGQIQLGTNVRLKNNAGSLQARNSGDSAFANLEAAVITSAFQTLAGDPSTLDIATGLGRLVKNTLTNEIAKFINDAGVIRRITTSPPWSSILSKPTTLAGYGITDAVASNDARITNGAITFLIDGGGSVIAVGEKSLLFRVPYNCTITGWELVANASGSIVIDVWKDSYANFPPTNGDSIVAAAKPTLASQVKAQSSTLTGWTTALNAGDYIKLEVESASTVNVAVLTLTVTRT